MNEEEQKAADAANPKDQLSDLSTEELVKIIKETRSEAKERRLREKELNDKITEFETKFETEAQNKKIAEGKKDEVILELQEKLKLKDKEFEPLKEKATKFDEYDATKRNKIKSILGDGWLSSFDTMPLVELEELASKLNSNVKLLDTDNGSNKKNSAKEYFTMDELKRLTSTELLNKETLEKANKSMEFHSKRN
jgi:hypothetical protein